MDFLGGGADLWVAERGGRVADGAALGDDDWGWGDVGGLGGWVWGLADGEAAVFVVIGDEDGGGSDRLADAVVLLADRGAAGGTKGDAGSWSLAGCAVDGVLFGGD